MELSVSKKSKFFCLLMLLITVSGMFVSVGTSVYASENVQEVSSNENENSGNVVIEYTKDGLVVTKYQDGYSTEDFADYSDIMTRVAVSRWGKLEYTNIAVTTGVGSVNNFV